MNLETRITEAIKASMKAKDKTALRGLRAVKSAIQLIKTDGTGKELDAAGEIQLLQKLVKQRRESKDIYEQQNRPDLAATEIEEIDIIVQFLPKQMDEAELKEAIQAIITNTGASSMKDMGRVMGLASKEFAGKADGKVVAGLVKQLLT